MNKSIVEGFPGFRSREDEGLVIFPSRVMFHLVGHMQVVVHLLSFSFMVVDVVGLGRCFWSSLDE